MMVLKGFLIVLVFTAGWAFIITALIIAVADDEDDEIVELTPEELAEERYKYACYEDTEIEN